MLYSFLSPFHINFTKIVKYYWFQNLKCSSDIEALFDGEKLYSKVSTKGGQKVMRMLAQYEHKAFKVVTLYSGM